MAALYAALCIIQTLLGIGPRKDESRNTTDWLKLALAVAAQPEDEESKRLVHVALESNNQEFLGLLRAALDTRVTAAARLADVESDGIECRAFLPGSPALWGWTTNTVAESAILKAGIESAMSASVFDSPLASCSRTGEDVFIGFNSSETMGGATLRDVYAKAWEFHREPLIWTPRGPGAGLGATTWTLTPASLTSQGRKRNRSVSDASESRSSIVSQSPCLHAQRNRIRRDSLHDVFTAIDTKKGSKTSPCAEAGIIVPAPSLVTPPLPSALSEPPVSRRPRRSTSCTRSHVSSTTAVTLSECSTTQELQGLGLGRSLDRSVWLRPDTPSDSWFGDCEPGKEITSKGKRVAPSHTAGSRGLVSSAAAFRRNKASSRSNFKQTKVYRPGIAPLQQSRTSVPKRMNELQPLASATPKNHGDVVRTARINSLVTGVQCGSAAHSQEPSSLRRVRSVAAMTPSPSPCSSRVAGRKAPLIGPVPAARRVSTKLAPAELRATQDSSQGSIQDKQSLYSHPVSTPAAPRQSGTNMPNMFQSRIPRPVSRAGSVSGPVRARSPSASSALCTPRREPQQLLTPISTVRVRERASSQAVHPVPTSSMGRARSRTGSSTQERPSFAKDIRLSRPPSRAHPTSGSSDVVRHRSKRSDSITNVISVGGQGSLAGKAIAIKDNICTVDMPTTCSSKILQDFQPPYDATCVRLLRDAGASIAGKTNCDEFGMGSLNIYSSHGAVVNPLSRDGEPRSAGGSSGGSAAAIAARMCFAALGTDTGGSIRLPAAYCGVAGLKPSYGMVSRWGVISYADSLDCVGVLASTVADAKTVYDAISHYDVRDPSSVPEDLRKSAHAASRARLDSFNSNIGSLSGIRIGIPQEYFPAELDQAALGPFRVLIFNLALRGAKIVPVSLPSTSYALSAYYVLASAEASSNLSRYDGIRYGSRVDVPEGTDLSYARNAYAATRSAGFGDEAKKRVLLGTYALSADAFENYFLQAQRVRALVRDDFNEVFGNRAPNLLQPSPPALSSEGVDVLLHPSAIRTAPPLSSAGESSIDAYVQDVLTVPASLAGLPALSVPYGNGADGWPLGASVVGQWGYDAIVCHVGQAIEACVKATEVK